MNKQDIVSIIGKHVKLKKVGKYYWGLCPFHKEGIPSLCVIPDRNQYHCYGCDHGGDGADFLQRIQEKK